MSLEVLLVFAVTEFLLSLTPGPAVLLVISQGMRYGFAPSIRGALGILTLNSFSAWGWSPSRWNAQSCWRMAGSPSAGKDFSRRGGCLPYRIASRGAS
jgi:hypothetical protein